MSAPRTEVTPNMLKLLGAESQVRVNTIFIGLPHHPVVIVISAQVRLIITMIVPHLPEQDIIIRLNPSPAMVPRVH